ncbi:hypothetical protein RJ639_006351 [Escallonia herrerae]|uniref:HMA domain-containing protein n=1 Tax=Escallonia herrerae TaxID=1293975 RepID=A0AA88VVT7_9ASTE|nr:hypothetical protein RJ639_006351 [Escallonia herrerae]
MKGMDIFCASQAATAIRLSMDEAPSSSSSSITHLGCTSGRAIDRYNPIIRDERRTAKAPFIAPPCTTSSQPPITPKPHNHIHHHHHHKSSRKTIPSTSSSKPNDKKKKTVTYVEPSSATETTSTVGSVVRKSSWSCAKPSEFISPPSSSRYLLGDKAFFSALADIDPVFALVPVDSLKSRAVKDDNESSTPKKAPSPTPRSSDQEVVLRVSLHCRGCERKMRKHISRMEGVTSFNIDFAAKKLTVVGDVTPLAVLASVSKVKNAQLLTPPSSSPALPVGSNLSEIKKLKEVVV